ncbi:MAG: nucleoside kinase [Bacilli bacterium]|jgi:uridine kinase
MNNIKVNYLNQEYEVGSGTTLFEFSKKFSNDYQFPIIIGKINHKVAELNTKIQKDCQIELFDISSVIGNRVYERGLIFLYVKAIKNILNKDVIIEHSIDRGIYTEIVDYQEEFTDQVINTIIVEMEKLVSQKLSFEKLSLLRTEAIDYFEKNQETSKADLLKYISNTYVNFYRLDGMYDYFYGEMPIDTSILKWFDLTKTDSNGIVLSFPNVYLDCQITDYVHHKMLFNEFINYHQWIETINLNNVSDLNREISRDGAKELVYMCENEQNSRLMDIAKTIKNNNKRLILIAGPSSSGKTTTSKKLVMYLKSLGLNPQELSVDDYFLNREVTPKKSNGAYDFESIAAVNVELFKKQMQDLLANQEVELPKYNFLLGKNEMSGKRFKLAANDLLIIEGLHALNPQLMPIVEKEQVYKIYLSPLTSLNLDNHNRVSTTDNRILRRMIRDNKHRGYNAETTLGNWQNVREGEENYVFPYQDEADVVFNTSLIYELGALRVFAEPLLFSISEDSPHYSEALRLINLLRTALPISGENIPHDSIIREFIGNNYFK